MSVLSDSLATHNNVSLRTSVYGVYAAGSALGSLARESNMVNANQTGAILRLTVTKPFTPVLTVFTPMKFCHMLIPFRRKIGALCDIFATFIIS